MMNYTTNRSSSYGKLLLFVTLNVAKCNKHITVPILLGPVSYYGIAKQYTIKYQYLQNVLIFVEHDVFITN